MTKTKASKASKPAPKASKPAPKASKATAVVIVDKVAEKAAAITEANKRLDPLAKTINVRLEKAAKLEGDADDHRLAAALEMARAAQLCEGAGIKFKDWAIEHIKGQSYENVRKLLAVGKADEPAKALADLRAGAKKAQAKHREKVKAKVQAANVPKLEAPKPIDVVAGLKPEDQIALVKKVSKDLGMAVVSDSDAKALDQFRKDPPKKAEAAPAAKSPFGYDAVVAGIGDLKQSEKLKLLRWLGEVLGYNVTAKTEAEKKDFDAIPDFLKVDKK
jgi:hypothetical protein